MTSKSPHFHISTLESFVNDVCGGYNLWEITRNNV